MTYGVLVRQGVRVRTVSALLALTGGLALVPGATAVASPSTTEPPSRPQSLTDYYAQRLTWHSCSSGSMKCGSVRVPIDYENLARGSFTLAVSRVPATGTRRGFLLTNPGGPGAQGLDFAKDVQSFLTPQLSERYDVIGFDTRGVGASAPVTCMTGRQTTAWLRIDATPDTKREIDDYMKASAAISRGCLATTPKRARHIGSSDTVRDMDIIRAALGTAKLDYLGYSYGTLLGAQYAQAFPDRVGRLLLDGAVNPSQDAMQVSAAQSFGFQQAITAFAKDCSAKSTCAYVGGTQAVLDGINGLLAQLDRSPMPTMLNETLTQSQALSAIFQAMYSTAFWPELRSALRQASRGDGTGLLAIANLGADRTGRYTYSSNINSAFYAISCWDSPAPPGAAGLRKAAHRWSSGVAVPEMASALAWGNAPCSAWFAHSSELPAPVTSTTTAPILIIGNTGDPATPLANAKALSRQLTTSGLLTFDGYGHTAFGNQSPCLDGYVTDYLIAGTLPPAGTICR